ncbi:MAG: hypothetical protein KGI08_09835, partial [Thaumarchaeota archaeon]|nr:hypothetical protein [Nitrososphaerota archaeon]
MSNVNIIQAEIARATQGTILQQTPLTELTPIGTPQPPFTRAYSKSVLQSLLRTGFSVSDQGRKEYLNLTPWNQESQPAVEVSIPSYSTLAPTITYVNPFTGAVYPQGNVANIPIEDLPYNFVKEDNLILTAGTIAQRGINQVFTWTPDSTRYVYKIVINIPLAVYVSNWTAGTYGFTNLALTIKNQQTNQNIIAPINVPLSSTLGANGLNIVVLRGVLTFPQIIQQKILFGQQLLINLNVETEQGSTTGYTGVIDSLPDLLTNNTKRFYPAVIGIHSYAGPDHLDNVINEASYSNR